MAGRAGQGAAETAEGRRGSVAGSAPLFTSAIRIALLSAMLLLAIYTVLTVARLTRAGLAPTTSSQAAAQLLAADAEAKLDRLETSVQAVAALARRGSAPQELADLALRLGSPVAGGAAVVGLRSGLATAGSAPAADWSTAVEAARASGRTIWIGAPRSPGGARGRWTYAVGALSVGGQTGFAVLAADLSSLTGTSPDQTRALATADGSLMAASGLPDTAQDLSALGLDPRQGAIYSRIGRDVPGRLDGGRPARIGVALSPDGEVVAAIATPSAAVAGARRTNLASNLFSLLAPLLIGCGLMVMLVLQSRRARAAQQSHSESERRFRLAVEASHCGIWEWRLKDQLVVMSDVTGVMLGWGGGGVASSDDVIARILPEHREPVRQALKDASQFGAFDVSFCVPRAAGPSAWIDMRGQAFGEADGQRFDTIIGVALDVTEERTAGQRAQAAERRLHDAIDSVSEAFVLWDRRGRLLMCNENFRDFFSLEPKLLKAGAPRETVLKVAELAIKRRLPAPQGRRGVREVELSDGRWLQISERRTAEGGLVMTAADITTIKREEEARRLNEQALRNAVTRLEESSRELSDLAEKYQAEKLRAEGANTAKSEFLANMSHELRTPLNAINGFSEMMVTEMFGPLGDPRYKEYMQDILASGQHLLALINDILDMSKIEAGKMALHFDYVEARDLIEEAIRLMRNRADAAGLQLSAEIAPDLPEIEADYRAVKQVLLNLLSNAIKFTPQGGRVDVRAALVGEGAARRVHVSVSDTGIGIARHDLGRLAQPFEQIETQHSKTAQGTGLGLALSKSLVELHGGEFQLESEQGVGTTATFTLPVERQSAPAPARAAPPPAPHANPGPAPGGVPSAAEAAARQSSFSPT